MGARQDDDYYDDNLRRAELKKIVKETSETDGDLLLRRCLPHLADLTFSDGACIGQALENGELSLIGQSAGSSGNQITVCVERSRSAIWKICYDGGDGFLQSHLTEEQTSGYGVRVPNGGSIIVEPIRARTVPHSGILCWRSNSGGGKYSKCPYEVWDVPMLEIAVMLIASVLDIELYTSEKARLDGILDAINTARDLIYPQITCLQSMIRDFPQEIFNQIQPKIDKLHSNFSCLSHMLADLGRDN